MLNLFIIITLTQIAKYTPINKSDIIFWRQSSVYFWVVKLIWPNDGKLWPSKYLNICIIEKIADSVSFNATDEVIVYYWRNCKWNRLCTYPMEKGPLVRTPQKYLRLFSCLVHLPRMRQKIIADISRSRIHENKS